MSRYISSNEFFDKVNSLFDPNSKRTSSSLTLDKEYGDFNVSHFSTGLGISYTSFKGSLNTDTIIEGFTKEDSSFISFNTFSKINMHDLNNDKNLEFLSGSYLGGNQYSGHKSNAYYQKNKFYNAHHIVFEPTLFKELIVNNINEKDSKRFFVGNNVDIYFNNIITLYQKKLLQEISQIAIVDDKLKELYLESRILELIYDSIKSIETGIDEDIFLDNKDIECLNKAKDMLLENSINPLSLKQLAYKSAINEFKLKKGFKQLFGNTVFGYLQEYRLNKANELLKTNDISINEAASLVGYKSASHFCKIFKEHFSLTPMEVKKKSRKIYY